MSSSVAVATPAVHRSLPVLDATGADWHPFLRSVPTGRPTEPHDSAIRAAGRSRRSLPDEVHDALADFGGQRDAGDLGALLLRGVPLGPVPATPHHPTDPSGTDGTPEHLLLTVARSLGHPVGYSAEHGGRIIQNLLPTREGATRQISTSSAVELEFHTETSFHPHRPRFLLLLCLRGHAAAQTLLCDVSEVAARLDPDVRRILGEARFRTGVDESFTGGRPVALGPPMRVLSGAADSPTLIFDQELMVGTDAEAAAALTELGRVARALRIGVVLAPGDLLVVDNHACIHGRTAFTARFDGTDRWLQRSFVVSDLSPSAAERIDSVITTRFS